LKAAIFIQQPAKTCRPGLSEKSNLITTSIKPPKLAIFRSLPKNWHGLCEVLFEIAYPGISHAKVTVERPHN
jgi:hypothetical protein